METIIRAYCTVKRASDLGWSCVTGGDTGYTTAWLTLDYPPVSRHGLYLTLHDAEAHIRNLRVSTTD